MKRCLVVFFLILISTKIFPQRILLDTFKIKSFMFQKPEVHKINTDLLKYHSIQLRKSRMLTYSPMHKIKITIKTGLNRNIICAVDSAALVAGDYEDAFNDVEASETVNILRYDARVKFYISKRWRFIMRAQLLGFNRNLYTFGFFWKV